MPANHEETTRPSKLYKVSEPDVDRYGDQKKESAETRRGGAKAVRIAQINGAGRRLCQAAIAHVSVGNITFKEAFGLLDVRTIRALREIGDIVGIRL